MSLIKGAKSKPLPKFQKPENEFLTHSQTNDDDDNDEENCIDNDYCD